ncbi:uncharacterized protein LOC116604303 [Nematostella vectensis]|uniref:uncharacterized protein LOC116604303 n=1 Tax=Nematostella vectensis TaxID=45351 RepID=UPI00138FC236|nr:uncharacterized protein LOC116604303 [Nematostella vectensis]
MSQLHQEALRKQVVVDKKYNSEYAWVTTPDMLSNATPSGDQSLPHTARSRNDSYNTQRSSACRPESKQQAVVDPYLLALTKETRARTRHRFSSIDYQMQW